RFSERNSRRRQQIPRRKKREGRFDRSLAPIAPQPRGSCLGVFLAFCLLTRVTRHGTSCTMTSRKADTAKVRSPLTELENDVMQAVWKIAPCTVESVHEIVSRKHKLKEASTRTLLRRLEKKGYLTHESDGRAYVYRAAEPARSIAARAVKQIIDRFCRGSVEELVSGMVESKVLSEREMAQLEKFVRSRRAK